ncbi:MAG: LLM class flavin-dependent oxidoreductase [Thaumarchaeota archaeon]|nr:MAG: LLM class flavin-dependent oxidoreductase [Nitrososphaerota archaeon]
MIKFGYAAQQEQHHPLALLSHARLAEKAGFDSIWSSDHFHPWADKNAHSAFA